VSCKQSGNHTDLINIHDVDITRKYTRVHIFFSPSLSLSFSLSFFFMPNNLIGVGRADFNCRIIPITSNAIISAQLARIAEKAGEQEEGERKKQRCKLFPARWGWRGNRASLGRAIKSARGESTSRPPEHPRHNWQSNRFTVINAVTATLRRAPALHLHIHDKEKERERERVGLGGDRQSRGGYRTRSSRINLIYKY